MFLTQKGFCVSSSSFHRQKRSPHRQKRDFTAEREGQKGVGGKEWEGEKVDCAMQRRVGGGRILCVACSEAKSISSVPNACPILIHAQMDTSFSVS